MLRVRLKPSRMLAGLFIAAHFAAAATLVPLAMPPWATGLVALAIAASLLKVLRYTALLRSATSIVALELRGKDSAAIRTRGGEWRAARILGTTCVSPLLTVVNLRVTGARGTRHVVIVPDRLDADDFRKMRVRLRWDYRQTAGSRDVVSS